MEQETVFSYDSIGTVATASHLDERLEELKLELKLNMVQYFNDKERLEKLTRNRVTFSMFLQSVYSLPRKALNILDLGCGMLSMLSLLQNHTALFDNFRIRYIGVELNKAIQAQMYERAKTAGWQFHSSKDDKAFEFTNGIHSLLLLYDDFYSVDSTSWYLGLENEPVDVVVGNCFIDLVEPARFVPWLYQVAPAGVFYFPSTYDGYTAIEEDRAADFLLQLYNDALIARGQVIDSKKHLAKLHETGAIIDSIGNSDFRIAPDHFPDTWRSYLHFFLQMLDTAAVPLVQRCLQKRPAIIVHNQDITGRLSTR